MLKHGHESWLDYQLRKGFLIIFNALGVWGSTNTSWASQIFAQPLKLNSSPNRDMLILGSRWKTTKGPSQTRARPTTCNLEQAKRGTLPAPMTRSCCLWAALEEAGTHGAISLSVAYGRAQPVILHSRGRHVTLWFGVEPGLENLWVLSQRETSLSSTLDKIL